MNKKIVVLSIISIILALAVPAIAQETHFTTTTLYYNVAALNEVKVQLLGKGWTTATTGGQATADNIEFNSTTGLDAWVEARVTGGGSTQSTGNPIVLIDNTGSTTVVWLNISTTAAPPSCNDLHFKNASWTATPADEAQLNTTNVTLIQNWPFNGGTYSVYLWGNFSNCGVGTQSGTFRVYAYFA